MLDLILASVFGISWLIATVFIVCSMFCAWDGVILRATLKVVPVAIVCMALAFLGMLLSIIYRV